jgi:hypothetical protein
MFLSIIQKAVPQLRKLVIGFPLWWSGFDPRSGNLRFVLDEVTLEQVFSEYLGFHCPFSFQQMLHAHYRLSSGAGAIDQRVADIPSGLTPPQKQTPRLESESKLYEPSQLLWTEGCCIVRGAETLWP